MTRSQSGVPRRSPAVALLDTAVGVPHTLARAVVRRIRRLSAGLRRSRLRMTLAVICAVAAVAGGTAIVASEMVDRPELLAPLGIGGGPAASPTVEPADPSPAEPPPPTPQSGQVQPHPASSAPSTAPATSVPATSTTTDQPTSPPPPAAPARLAARYGTVTGETTLVGYGAAITVSNSGATAADGWTVVLTLPRPTLRISDVRGATVVRDGAVWTFTPDATTRAVAAGAAQVIHFVVGGAPLQSAPTACTIDGAACTMTAA